MSRKNKRTRFAGTIPRHVKRTSGRTPVERTPLAIRTNGVEVSDDTREYASRRMSSKLAKFAERIERLTVRLDDVNGPRGGIDTRCRVKVVLSGLDSLVYEALGKDALEAIDRAAGGAERAVRRTLGRSGGARGGGAKRSTGRAASKASEAPARDVESEDGSLIGRRVGHGPANLEAALDRPEKRRGDAIVDTAAPGVSATDRRAGGASTARRNSKRSTSRATSMLEDSAQTRPSRKSTRRSANRSKRDSNLRRRQTRKTSAPSARAARDRVRAH